MAKKKTLEDFLLKAKKIRPEYDFSLVTEYVNNSTKIPVICHKKDFAGREHGIFMITPADLLSGKGCSKCKGKGFTNEDRKLFCNILYKGKYDYSKSDFSKVKRKTTVSCQEHGDFETSFDKHFNQKIGCKYCSYPVRDTNSFKKEAAIVHNGYYKYDNAIYIDSHTKLLVSCPIHGDFLQTPNAHLRGEGCPECRKISILENKIENMLNENSIKYIKDKRAKWLITDIGGYSHLDFFIPEINLAIECQGKQHFGFGGWSDKYDFNKQYEIDKWKKKQCNERNIKLVYFSNKYKMINSYIGEIFTSEEELLKYIKYLLLNKNNKV